VLPLLLAAAFALKQDVLQQNVTAIVVRDGFYRQLTVAANPDVPALLAGTATAVSVAAIGAKIEQTGGGKVSAAVDVAGFKFKNPDDISDGTDAANRGLVFYFGYVGVRGTWDPTTKTASVAGALAEVAASWEYVFAFYDHNGKPGFQWEMGQDMFDCAKATLQSYDCVDPFGVITFTNITWGGLTVRNQSCPSTYQNENCTIWSISTMSDDGVITFTLHLASEPVFINGVRVEPNYGKIDVTINYPYTSKALANAAEARVGVLAYTAGRAGAGAAFYQKVGDKEAVQYAVEDKSAYFAWDGEAKLQGANSYVHVDAHSGKSIIALDCSQCVWASWFVLGLKLRAAAIEYAGYRTEMLIFSWAEARPASVFWDPAIGVTDYSAATTAAPTVLAAFVAIAAAVSSMF